MYKPGNKKDKKIDIDSDEYIIEKIKECTTIIYDKRDLLKAYQYYNCKRDADQFKNLEEQYGLSASTTIKFIPLVRSHIDVLVGEYLSKPISHKVSCKDTSTLNNILREKQLSITSDVYNFYKTKLNSDIFKIFVEGAKDKIPQDPLIQSQLEKLKEDLELSYTSEYEIAAQNILDYLEQWDVFDFKSNLKRLLIDFLITGTCYYRVKAHENQVKLEVLHPINTFIDRNINSPYLKDSYRAVVRRFMHVEHIKQEFGQYLDKEALELLEDDSNKGYAPGVIQYGIQALNSPTPGLLSENLLYSAESYPIAPFANNRRNLFYNKFAVYEVEWIEVIEKDGKQVMELYSGIQIGTSIFIPIGKNNDSYRTSLDPTYTCLTINGMFYSDNTGQPFSMVQATMDLQDKFDILHFFRDNLIANSGVRGDFIDVSQIPTFLGTELEGLTKLIEYKKAGVVPINTAQEGRGATNTIYAGYDDTLQAGTIQAFEMAIESIRNTVSTITGVFRERLGGIEQRDAVANVEMGMQMSYIITAQYYQMMDLITRNILSDGLNMCKRVFKDGITGVLVLGDKKNKIFTSLPEHYTHTDFDIHINSSTDVNKEIEMIKQITLELVKGGLVDAEIVLETVGATSLTGLKHNMRTAINKKKSENDQLMQMSQQMQQAAEMQKQSEKQIEDLTTMNQKLKEESQNKNYQFEQSKLNIEREKIKIDKEYKDRQIQLKKQQIEAEIAQLIDTNPNNDEIKNIA